MPKTFMAKFYVLPDEEEGTETILPREKDMRKELARVESDEKALRAMLDREAEAEMVKEEAARGLVRCALARNKIEGMLSNLRNLQAASELQTYTLKRPGLGRYMEAEAAAKTLEDDEVRVDTNKKIENMLQDTVVGYEDGKALEELAPNIALYLYDVIDNACRPDPNRIDFLSVPAANTSKAG